MPEPSPFARRRERETVETRVTERQPLPVRPAADGPPTPRPTSTSRPSCAARGSDSRRVSARYLRVWTRVLAVSDQPRRLEQRDFSRSYQTVFIRSGGEDRRWTARPATDRGGCRTAPSTWRPSGTGADADRPDPRRLRASLTASAPRGRENARDPVGVRFVAVTKGCRLDGRAGRSSRGPGRVRGEPGPGGGGEGRRAARGRLALRGPSAVEQGAPRPRPVPHRPLGGLARAARAARPHRPRGRTPPQVVAAGEPHRRGQKAGFEPEDLERPTRRRWRMPAGWHRSAS